MTKLYEGVGRKGLNIGRVFHKCKQPGCAGAATEETLGYCHKHCSAEGARNQGVTGDLTGAMDILTIRPKHDPKSHRESRRIPSAGTRDRVSRVNISHNVGEKHEEHILGKDMHYVLQLNKDDQVTYHYSRDPDLVESSDVFWCTESKPNRRRCIGPDCFNTGVSDFKGLCRECYQILSLTNKCDINSKPTVDKPLNVCLHELASNQMECLNDSERESTQVNDQTSSMTPLHSCENSDITNLQDSPLDIEKEQPNLIDLSTTEIPLEIEDSVVRERKAQQTVGCIQTTSHARNEETWTTKRHLIDLSLSELPQNGYDKQAYFPVDSNPVSLEDFFLQQEMYTPREEQAETPEPHTSAVNFDLRLPCEVSEECSATKHSHLMDLQPNRQSSKCLQNTRGEIPCIDQGIKVCKNPTMERKKSQTDADKNHSDFQKLIQSIEKQSRSASKTCLARGCRNFGNNHCMGLCNSCFKSINGY